MTQTSEPIEAMPNVSLKGIGVAVSFKAVSSEPSLGPVRKVPYHPPFVAISQSVHRGRYRVTQVGHDWLAFVDPFEAASAKQVAWCVADRPFQEVEYRPLRKGQAEGEA
jgi:hypothetical protein